MNNQIKRLLIVDDSESIRALLLKELSSNGYVVKEAINGVDGMRKIEEEGPFNMIISDFNMPTCNGLEFLKKVRNNASTRFTPFIVVTTENQIEKKNEAKLNGATGWIIKPFMMESLITVIKKIIG